MKVSTFIVSAHESLKMSEKMQKFLNTLFCLNMGQFKLKTTNVDLNSFILFVFVKTFTSSIFVVVFGIF